LDLDKLKHRKLSLMCLGFTPMNVPQILLCDLSVQIICVPITTQDIQFLSAFLVFFFALLVWFIVVVGTNIVNHYLLITLIPLRLK
jgi:hypothetical protein